MLRRQIIKGGSAGTGSHGLPGSGRIIWKASASDPSLRAFAWGVLCGRQFGTQRKKSRGWQPVVSTQGRAKVKPTGREDPGQAHRVWGNADGCSRDRVCFQNEG